MPKIGLLYRLEGSIDEIAESAKKLKHAKDDIKYFSKNSTVSELDQIHCPNRSIIFQLSGDKLEDTVRATSVFLERAGDPDQVIPYDTPYDDIVQKAKDMEHIRKTGKLDWKQWIPVYGYAKSIDAYKLREPSLDDNCRVSAPLFRLYQLGVCLVTLPISLPYLLIRHNLKNK